MLPADIKRLIKEAEGAMENAIAPYSGFVVGAALLTDDNEIYRGCNIENPSLMLSFCAERAALVKALSEGKRNFRAMAIVSKEGKYCFPCGSCRQMIAEFAPDIELYLSSHEGVKKYSIPELLPRFFRR